MGDAQGCSVWREPPHLSGYSLQLFGGLWLHNLWAFAFVARCTVYIQKVFWQRPCSWPRTSLTWGLLHSASAEHQRWRDRMYRTLSQYHQLDNLRAWIDFQIDICLDSYLLCHPKCSICTVTHPCCASRSVDGVASTHRGLRSNDGRRHGKDSHVL